MAARRSSASVLLTTYRLALVRHHAPPPSSLLTFSPQQACAEEDPATILAKHCKSTSSLHSFSPTRLKFTWCLNRNPYSTSPTLTRSSQARPPRTQLCRTCSSPRPCRTSLLGLCITQLTSTSGRMLVMVTVWSGQAPGPLTFSRFHVLGTTRIVSPILPPFFASNLAHLHHHSPRAHACVPPAPPIYSIIVQ